MPRHMAIWFGVCALFVGMAACQRPAAEPAPPSTSAGTEQPKPEAPPAQTEPGRGRGPGQDLCPMTLQGTAVEMSNIERGAAITFITEGDVPQLQSRVRAMAAHHTRMHGQGAPPGRGMGRGMGPGMAGPPAPPSTANVVDVESGARLEVRADDPDDVPQLREHMRARAQHMQSEGRCPLLEQSVE